MGDANLSAVTNALEQFIRQGAVKRQRNRSAVLLALLEKRQGSGKNCAWDVTVGSGTGTTYTDGQDVSSFSDDTELMAKLDWGIYGDAFGITALAESASASSRTEHARLFMKKLTDAMGRVADKVNTDLYTGNGTAPQVHGLTASSGPLDSTGTYAGLARATYPDWAGNVDSNSGVLRPLTFDLLQKQFQTIWDASGRVPTLVISGSALWRKYGAMHQPEKRYVKEIEVRGELIRLDGGWQALEINGVPWVKDRHVPANTVLFLCMDELWLEYLPPNDRVRAKDLAMIPIAGTPQEQQMMAGREPLMARVRALAEAGDYSRFQLVSWISLGTDRPNSHAWLKDVANT